jgi:hypothetical protein
MGNGSLDFGEPGGSVDVDFGLDYGVGDPYNRMVMNMTGNATWLTDWTMTCSGTTVTGQDPYLWTWFEQPAAHSISVRPDGTFGITVGEDPKIYSYEFTPMREP